MKHPQSYSQIIENIKFVHPYGKEILECVVNGDTQHVKDHVEDAFLEDILTDMTRAIAASLEFQDNYLGTGEETEEFGYALRKTYAPILLAILSNPERFTE